MYGYENIYINMNEWYTIQYKYITLCNMCTTKSYNMFLYFYILSRYYTTI